MKVEFLEFTEEITIHDVFHKRLTYGPWRPMFRLRDNQKRREKTYLPYNPNRMFVKQAC